MPERSLLPSVIVAVQLIQFEKGPDLKSRPRLYGHRPFKFVAGVTSGDASLGANLIVALPDIVSVGWIHPPIAVSVAIVECAPAIVGRGISP